MSKFGITFEYFLMNQALSQQAERKGAADAAGSSVILSDNETGNEYQLEEFKEKA